jgi:inorganic pyrophosphatase
MTFDRVPAGKDVPNDCNVIIEIPMRADPIKYEIDKETGAVFVDRFMSTAMHYPMQLRLHPAHAVRRRRSVRCAGAFAYAAHRGRRRRVPADRHAEDGRRGGSDSKILAVPVDKLTDLYRNVHAPEDMPGASHEADRPLLRALQGPRARQMGPRFVLGRRRRSEA